MAARLGLRLAPDCLPYIDTSRELVRRDGRAVGTIMLIVERHLRCRVPHAKTNPLTFRFANVAHSTHCAMRISENSSILPQSRIHIPHLPMSVPEHESTDCQLGLIKLYSLQ